MRKNIIINNEKYIFDDRVRDNLAVRTGFDRLAQQTFDISFEEWHKCGWWQENYQPHLLLRDGKVAANLSVNRIGCQINGVRRRMFPMPTFISAIPRCPEEISSVWESFRSNSSAASFSDCPSIENSSL